jgi:hypothetical protein
MKLSLRYILAASAILSIGANAQSNTQSLSGSFILAEEGSGVSQPVASIAILKFTGDGNVSGLQLLRGPGSLTKLSAQGSYVLNSDGSGMLLLTTMTMPTDSSDPVQSTANYSLRWTRNRGIAAIRLDTGFFTIGTLAPSADPGPITGSFILAERGNGSPYAGLGRLSFDGSSAIAGAERVAALGMNSAFDLTGSYAMGSDGFGSFTLNIPFTDFSGNTGATAANYVFAQSTTQIFAIRTDGNSAIVSTLTAIQ